MNDVWKNYITHDSAKKISLIRFAMLHDIVVLSFVKAVKFSLVLLNTFFASNLVMFKAFHTALNPGLSSLRFCTVKAVLQC